MKEEFTDKEFEKHLKEALVRNSNEALREKWGSAIDKEIIKQKKRNRLKYILGIIVLSLLTYVLLEKSSLFNDTSVTYYAQNQLDADHLVLDPGIFQRGNEYENNSLIEAYILIESKNYEKALNVFNGLEDWVTWSSREDYYYAYLLAKNGDYVSAISKFNSMISERQDYIEESEWMLSLLYLRIGEINKARQLLVKIESKQQFKCQLAKEILRKIN